MLVNIICFSCFKLGSSLGRKIKLSYSIRNKVSLKPFPHFCKYQTLNSNGSVLFVPKNNRKALASHQENHSRAVSPFLLSVAVIIVLTVSHFEEQNDEIKPESFWHLFSIIITCAVLLLCCYFMRSVFLLLVFFFFHSSINNWFFFVFVMCMLCFEKF